MSATLERVNSGTAALDHYCELERRITVAEIDAVLARWQFGRALLGERVGKQLSKGRLAEVAAAVGRSESELRQRMWLASRYESEAEVVSALEAFGSWTGIRDNLAVEPHRREQHPIKVAPHSLRRNDFNPNRLSDREEAALRESIQRFGINYPLTVRPLLAGVYELIDGEHRWQIAQEFGLPTVPIRVVDADDAEARALAIQLNDTRGELDPIKLGQLLLAAKEQDADGFRLGMRYPDFELDLLLRMGAVDSTVWASYRRTDPSAGQAQDDVTITLRVSREVADAFARKLEAEGGDHGPRTRGQLLARLLTARTRKQGSA